ncbi:amino acid ABC transporter substrate-binding protein, PAAT family [Marinobacter daqiaonensis]|uniref:Amino acid ABC transporter substrate-binding protein, PAAT family n=1 Tax=Marinobacter daqiaonensis TaxID=650891 RepID=A0A1I6GI48_9GAMM|nr:transporter substrate-binding domain-containing protein [Marinobacter daqiaonensis]SFR41854.1 amino acid ABC transporter substrate-binding protein, PAAT family [Marinobacter daqiaonensis]
MAYPNGNLLTGAFIALLMASVAPASIATQVSSSEDDEARPLDGKQHLLRLNVSTNGYPPYLIIEEDGSYGGIVYDVVSRIADRTGYTVEPHEVPRKRVDDLLLRGLIDATPRAREWTEEPGRFLFTDPIVPIREVFFSRADSDFRFGELDRLGGITLVTPLGYHYPQLEPLFENGTVERYEVRHDRDMFRYLLHGPNFDAAVADLTVGQWIIRQNNWKGEFKHSDKAISQYGYRLMLRPEWQDFAEMFNDELADMKASGELDDILDQYR